MDQANLGVSSLRAVSLLALADLQEALHEFVVKSGWLCSGELNALFNSLGPTEHRFLAGMFSPATDGSQ